MTRTALAVLVLAACTAPGSDPRSGSAAELERIARHHDLAGLAVVTFEDGLVDRADSFGVASRSTGAPIGEDTLFLAVSLTKPVVALLALELARSGEFDLDAPLLPLARRRAPARWSALEADPRAREITARHATAHTSGLPDRRDATGVRLEAGPGTVFRYSGEGYELLGDAIEGRTGQSLDGLVRDRLFRPRGLAHSHLAAPSGDPDDFAVGHGLDGEAIPRPPRARPRASGTLATTALELAQLFAELDAETLLALGEPVVTVEGAAQLGPRAHRESALPTELALAWGFGLGNFRADGRRLFFHNAEAAGFRGLLILDPEERAGAVLLSNDARFDAAAPALVEALLGIETPLFDWLGQGRADRVETR